MGCVQRRKTRQESNINSNEDDMFHDESYELSNKRNPDPNVNNINNGDLFHHYYNQKYQLTLMEELMLISRTDQKDIITSITTSLSGSIRCCIIIELGLLGRIQTTSESNPKYIQDKLIRVVDISQTGDAILDEALGIIAQTKKSVSRWITVLNYNSINISSTGLSMKQVCRRILKGLVDKGIVGKERQHFFIFESSEYTIINYEQKNEILLRITNMLLGQGPPPTLRTLLLVLVAESAGIVYNILHHLKPVLRVVAAERSHKILKVFSDLYTYNVPNSDLTLPFDIARHLPLVTNDVVAGVIGYLGTLEINMF